MDLPRLGLAAIWLCFGVSLFADDAFSIPTFPGTQASHHSGDQTQVGLPFVTITTIFKTQDGAPLQEKAVLDFYRTYYEKRGWKQSVFYKPSNEPYLELQWDAYGKAPPHSAIQIASRMYLWVAPKDGLITIFQYQWRNSRLLNPYYELFLQTVDRLKSSGKTLGYEVIELQPQAAFARYYEDETLVRMAALHLSLPSPQRRSDLDRSGSLEVTVLAYNDPAAAAKYAAPATKPNTSDSGSSVVYAELHEIGGYRKTSVLRENLVILLQPGDSKQEEAIKRLVASLPPVP